MSVYIYFRDVRWRIRCPYCNNANTLTMRKDKTIRCGKCENTFKIRHKLGEEEKIKWFMRVEGDEPKNINSN